MDIKNKINILSSIKNYKFNSIFIKNFLLISALTLIPLCMISFILYYNATSVVVSEAITSNESSLRRSRDLCDTLFNQADLIGANATLNDNVKELMQQQEESEFNQAIAPVNEFINMYTLIYEYLHSIYIYSEKHDFVVSNSDNANINDFSDNMWVGTYKADKNKNLIINSRKQSNIFPYFLSFIKPVSYNSETPVGAVVVNIDINKLNKLLNNADDAIAQNMYIVSDNGTILYSNDIEQVTKNVESVEFLKDAALLNHGFSGKMDINGENYLISVLDSVNGYPFRYISVTPMSYYAGMLNNVIGTIIIIMILTILIGMIAAFYISVKLYKPIGSIREVLSNVSIEDGTSKKEKFDELKFITESIVNTISDKEQAQDELRNRLDSLNRVHVIALQAQINPHFLYNTLETINWQAEELTNSSNEVTRSILSLSKLMRLYSESDSYIITLSQEEEYVKLYISILQQRYDDMFEMVWDIDDSIKENKVIKFCLQPIIENAVHHGIKPMEEGGIIKVRAYRENDRIVIKITDNGVGMDKQDIEKINVELKEKYTLKGKHIGLHNVNQRIKLIFGDDYGITVSSNAPTGLCVTVNLPDVQ